MKYQILLTLVTLWCPMLRIAHAQLDSANNTYPKYSMADHQLLLGIENYSDLNPGYVDRCGEYVLLKLKESHYQNEDCLFSAQYESFGQFQDKIRQVEESLAKNVNKANRFMGLTIILSIACVSLIWMNLKLRRYRKEILSIRNRIQQYKAQSKN